jgi:hypothetical protein
LRHCLAVKMRKQDDDGEYLGKEDEDFASKSIMLLLRLFTLDGVK